MDDLNATVAKNLVALRTAAHLTQLQLAEKLNYSDKAVSKWERGEAIPDIRVLIKLAELYNISVDDIVSPKKEEVIKPKMNTFKKRLLITLLSVALVWFVATVIFMIVFFIASVEEYAWLTFICAPFVSAIVLTVFSGLWGNRITNALSSSLLVWTAAVIVHIFVLTFAPAFDKMYFIYIVAGVFEVLIILFFVWRIFYRRKK